MLVTCVIAKTKTRSKKSSSGVTRSSRSEAATSGSYLLGVDLHRQAGERLAPLGGDEPRVLHVEALAPVGRDRVRVHREDHGPGEPGLGDFADSRALDLT